MARVKILPGSLKQRVSVGGNMKDRVAPEVVHDALGAAEAVKLALADESPLGFTAIRQELFGALRSTGGRPGFADADRRKVPVTEPVWRFVSDAAEKMSIPGFRPSAAQVASAILTMAVRRMAPDAMREAEHAVKAAMTADARGKVRDNTAIE